MGGRKSKEAVSTSGIGAISGIVASPGTSESQKSRSQSYLLIWVDNSFDEKKNKMPKYIEALAQCRQ